MKTILLIGLGRFGRHIAQKLNELDHQVMAIDKNENRVEAALPYVTSAQIGDATKKDFLSTVGVGNFDVCIVAIGDNFQSSLETTLLLKELGAQKVVSSKIRGQQSYQRCTCKISSQKRCRRNSLSRKAACFMDGDQIFLRSCL